MLFMLQALESHSSEKNILYFEKQRWQELIPKNSSVCFFIFFSFFPLEIPIIKGQKKCEK
jgi:hypothetical protein